MTKRELVTANREAILALAAKHGATNVRIFGSVARGDDDEASDVDVPVNFHGKSGLDAFGQQYDSEEKLSQLLKCSVDVVSDHRFLRERLRQNIERDMVVL